MSRRCTKALVRRVGELTSRIFNDAIVEVLGFTAETAEEDLHMAVDLVRHARSYAQDNLFPEDDVREMLESKEKIDALYLKKLLGLSSKQLDDIIVAHNAGHIKRMPKTMEAILSELARRSIFGDASESDNRYLHRKVIKSAIKDRDHSEKAKIKRDKTAKSRRCD